MKKQREKLLELISDSCKENFSTEWKKLNYKLIPVTAIPASVGKEEEFNKIYQALLNSDFGKIARTPSGGIAINSTARFDSFYKYDVRQINSVVEITVATIWKSFRIQWRLPNIKYIDESGEEEDLISAGKYLKKYWLPLCKKYNINMKDYSCSTEEGLKYKELIHKPDIKIYDTAASYNCVYDSAYHLDFHKFYISGLIRARPEFKPVVDDIMRLIAEAKANKDDKLAKLHKTGLASLVGYWQSPHCYYKFAKLSMLAINTAYERFDEIKADIKKNRRLLATNTDGLWYVGEEYHGNYEGSELTEWENDHKNCIIRFKSAGSYEFIEDDKYFPVVRGRTRLDKIKPRDTWQWGDIFQREAQLLTWRFIPGVGIIWKSEEELKKEKLAEKYKQN